jgi:hypothetical protein
MDRVIAELKAEGDRLEWDALYTMKGHFNAAMLWNATHYVLGITAVVLGAFAGKGLVGAEPSPNASAVATASAALAAIITLLKPSEKAQPHHAAGVFYNSIKRKARMFQNLSLATKSDLNALRKELDELVTAYHDHQLSAPPIPAPAYWITRRGVRAGEHTYNEPREQK